MNGERRVKPGDEPPVEGDAVAAGQRLGALRRLGVEQQPVGDVGVARDGGEVAAVGDADRLHHRPAEAGPDRGDALRRLVAVELEESGSIAATIVRQLARPTHRP